MRTGENECSQSFERGDGRSHLPHHVVAHLMAPEVQEDDVVLGRSLQPAHEPPQLILRHSPEARLFAFVLKCPVVPSVYIFPQVQLTRQLLTGVKSKSQVIVE